MTASAGDSCKREEEQGFKFRVFYHFGGHREHDPYRVFHCHPLPNHYVFIVLIARRLGVRSSSLSVSYASSGEGNAEDCVAASRAMQCAISIYQVPGIYVFNGGAFSVPPRRSVVDGCVCYARGL